MAYLKEAAEQMMKVSIKVSVVYIAGYSASNSWEHSERGGQRLVLGYVTAVAGFPILAVGPPVAALGGATNVVATISELPLKKKEVKRANELQNQQYCQGLVEEYQDFEVRSDYARTSSQTGILMVYLEMYLR